MRFSYFLMAGAALLVPWQAPAQDAEPASEAGQPEPDAAPDAAAQAPAEDCPPGLEGDFVPRFGQPDAWLDSERGVYTPAGATALGYPVGYVIVTGPSEGEAGTAPVRQLAYRLAGLSTAWGADYGPELRTAFDRAFDATACGDGAGSCVLDFRGAGPGQRSGAELSNRAPSIPPDARGNALALVKADFDLEGADPVYLVCHYLAP